MKTTALTVSLIALAAGAALAAGGSQDIHRASAPAQARQMAAPEQPAAPAVQATATFGQTIETALADTKNGNTTSFADPSGKFLVQVHAKGVEHQLSLRNNDTLQTQSWTIAPNAPRASIDDTISQIMKASGQVVAEPKGATGQLSDLGK